MDKELDGAQELGTGVAQGFTGEEDHEGEDQNLPNSSDEDDIASVSTNQNEDPSELDDLISGLVEGADAKNEDQEAVQVTKPDNSVAHSDEKKEPVADADEDEEILSTIKSDRGRERIRLKLQELKAVRTEATETREQVGAIAETLQQAQATPEQFAQALEFIRLTNSTNPEDNHLAYQMINDQMKFLTSRLGVSHAGYDPLSEHPDLLEKVDNLDLTRESAMELMRYRAQERERVAQVTAQQVEQQTIIQRQKEMDLFQQDAASFLNAKAHLIDHVPRQQAIAKYFEVQENVENFVRQSGGSRQSMLQMLQFMYENVQPSPRKQAITPLSSSSARSVGNSTVKLSPTDDMANFLAGMTE